MKNFFSNTELDKFEEYKKQNKKFLNNKLISSFLERAENQALLINAICHPSKENKEKLDITFKKYYFNIRFTSYISAALYYNAINYDKKYRKIQSRFPLTVDKPITDGDDGTFKDMICDPSTEYKIDDYLKSKSIIDYLEDPLLCRAIVSLTEKQRQLLDLAYVSGLNDTEIGIFLNKSQQAISKTHKKALQKIYDFLKREGGV